MAVRNACLLVAAMLFGLAACTSEPPNQQRVYEHLVTGDTTFARLSSQKGEEYYISGRYDSAVVAYDRARAHFEMASLWPEAVHSYAEAAKIAIKMGRHREVRSTIDEALRKAETNLGKAHPSLARIYLVISRLLQIEDDYRGADNIIEKAIGLADGRFITQPLFLSELYQESGIVLGDLNEMERADLHFQEAVKLLRASEAREYQWVPLHASIGNFLKMQGEYNSAIDTLTSATHLGIRFLSDSHPELAIIYKDLGEVYRRLGEYEKAFEYHGLGLLISQNTTWSNNPDTPKILNAIGIAHAESGNRDDAIAIYKKAIELNSELYGQLHHSVAVNYNNMALTYIDGGDFAIALDLLNSAIDIYNNLHGAIINNKAVSTNNLGKAYYAMGDYVNARRLWNDALRQFVAVHGQRHPYVANQLRSIGVVNLKLGAPEEALRNLQLALNILRTTSGEDDPYVGSVYSALAATYDKMEDIVHARQYYVRAAEHQIRRRGERHPLVAETYNDLGDFFREHSRYDEALESYKTALVANAPQSEKRVQSPIDSLGAMSEQQFIRTQWGIARLRVNLWKSGVGSLDELLSAMASFLEAASSIDRLRGTIRTTESKLKRAELEAPLLAEAVQLSLVLYQNTSDKRYLDLGFYFAEKSKASLLLEALSEARAKKFANTPDSLIDLEHTLISEVTVAEQRKIRAQSTEQPTSRTGLADVERQVFLAKQRRDEFIAQLEREYPEYYNLKYKVEVATPEEVRRILPDSETAVVEYVLGNKELFIFTLSGASYDAVAVPLDTLLEQRVAALRKGVVEQNYEQYTENAIILYRQLIAPIAVKVPASKLIIVPDGVLSYVPFEALLTKDISTDSGVRDYSRLPYLINERAISYAYSSTLLIETQQRRESEAQRDFMAFAPVFEGGLPIASRAAAVLKANGELNPTRSKAWLSGYLPMTRTEVKSIHRLFARQYNVLERFFTPKAKVYLDEDASEENLKKSSLENYRFVHFATHSFANETLPEANGIIMYPQEGMTATSGSRNGIDIDSDSEEDGVLRLGEVYNLKLNADLVVLSACETGLGPVARGEGILSLTRGFLYAGASNVLVSLWNADDTQTSTLMVDFYEELLGGSSKPEALRTAKLEIIRAHPRYARPYYWAPFVLVGK